MATEYEKLSIESSNEMMDYDGDRGLGRYASAAIHLQRAGFARVRMGTIRFEQGLHAAVADWLSAAECFFLAAQPERMKGCLEQIREFAGRIPADRKDILGAIREREDQFLELQRRVTKDLPNPKRDDSWKQYKDAKPRQLGNLHERMKFVLEAMQKGERDKPGSIPRDLWDGMYDLETEVGKHTPFPLCCGADS